MKKVNPDRQFFSFDAANVPALQIVSGEQVEFTCQDCWSNMLTDETVMKSALLRQGAAINPINGPVYVQDAQPGDTLKVHINSIEILGGYGRMAFYAPDLNVLSKYFDKEESVHVPIRDGIAEFFGGRVKLPVQPMLGVIATTPKDAPVSTMSGGHCGGNMDCKYLCAGTTIYLPVQVAGGLLGIGDLHARQGDGEVPAALEIPGKVLVTIELIKNRQESWPVLETDDAWYVLATEDLITDACFRAMDGMAAFLTKRGNGFSKLEWMILMGMAGDLEVCQIPNPRMTARYRIDKRVAAGMRF